MSYGWSLLEELIKLRFLPVSALKSVFDKQTCCACARWTLSVNVKWLRKFSLGKQTRKRRVHFTPHWARFSNKFNCIKLWQLEHIFSSGCDTKRFAMYIYFFFLLFLWLAFVFACCSLIVIFVDYRRKQRIIPNYYACSRQQKAYKQMGFNWPTARRGGNTLKDWSIFTNQLVHGLLCNLLLGYFNVSPV